MKKTQTIKNRIILIFLAILVVVSVFLVLYLDIFKFRADTVSDSATLQANLTYQDTDGAMQNTLSNSLKINRVPEFVPVVMTQPVTDITATSASLQGNIVNLNGIPTIGRGFQYGLVKIAEGAGAAGWSYDSGSFPVGAYSTSTTILTAGLRIKSNTTYFVRAIAKNAKGTGYGDWVSFTTKAGDTVATTPVVTTQEVTDITATSAFFHGNLVDTGGLPTTLRGFQYSLTQLPVGAGSAGYTYDTGSYQPGAFIRSTSPLMQGSLPLKANTVYYVRAIVRNTQGAGYGNWVSFTTKAGDAVATTPVVTTQEVTDITAISANFHGTIMSNLGTGIISRGFRFSLTKLDNVTASDGWTLQNPAAGTFYPVDAFTQTSSLAPANSLHLKASTTYWVQAIASNDKGRGFGNWISFTTKAN